MKYRVLDGLDLDNRAYAAGDTVAIDDDTIAAALAEAGVIEASEAPPRQGKQSDAVHRRATKSPGEGGEGDVDGSAVDGGDGVDDQDDGGEQSDAVPGTAGKPAGGEQSDAVPGTAGKPAGGEQSDAVPGTAGKPAGGEQSDAVPGTAGKPAGGEQSDAVPGTAGKPAGGEQSDAVPGTAGKPAGGDADADADRAARLLAAITLLKPDNSEHWTASGKPRTEALEAVSGLESVSAAERDAAWQNYLAGNGAS